MRSLLGRRAAGVAVAAGLLAGSMATPAHAGDELGLSWDGRTWSDHLDGTIFDPSVRWVPGDERTGHFFVRNQAPDGAALAVGVESPDRHALLERDDITVAARVGAAGWTTLAREGDAYPLTSRTIAAGESERIEVRAAFDPASTNQSQTKALDLTFRVVLSDATAAGGTNTGEGDGGPGSGAMLPETGAPRLGWVVLAAAAMIGAGAALVRRSRGEEVADV